MDCELFIYIMPYPNEHACRLIDPDKVKILGSGNRKHNGKIFRVLFGRLKGKTSGSREQAYRYPKGSWTANEARSHCKNHGGSFEAAISEFDLNPLIPGGD